MKITELGSSKNLNSPIPEFKNIENIILFAGEMPYNFYKEFSGTTTYSAGDVIYNTTDRVFMYAKYNISPGKGFNSNDWNKIQMFKDEYILNENVNNLNVAQLLNL